MFKIRLSPNYKGAKKKGIGKFIVTREWRECDKFIISKAIPFEGPVYEIQRAASADRKKVKAPTPMEPVESPPVEQIGEPILEPMVEVKSVSGDDVKDKEAGNILTDQNGTVVNEGVMLLPEESIIPEELVDPEAESMEDPPEIEGVDIVVKEAPESDEPETKAEPETEKPTVKKVPRKRGKGGKSGKRKR